MLVSATNVSVDFVPCSAISEGEREVIRQRLLANFNEPSPQVSTNVTLKDSCCFRNHAVFHPTYIYSRFIVI